MTAQAQHETIDRFLGGRVEAIQPDDGSHRSGLEAVLLGAALPESFAGTIVDLGAGVGVAGMCAAARCPRAGIVLVERDPVATAAARAALALPANAAFADRVRVVEADVVAPEAERVAAGLGRDFADAVITNPPFNTDRRGTVSPSAARAGAHVLGEGVLDGWMRTAASVLRPGGTLVLIFRADAVAPLLSLMEGRFGGLALLPLHARPGKPAHRILVRGIKGSRSPAAILPGLALHGDAGNSYVPAVDAVLRDGAGLAAAHPAWRVQEK